MGPPARAGGLDNWAPAFSDFAHYYPGKDIEDHDDRQIRAYLGQIPRHATRHAK